MIRLPYDDGRIGGMFAPSTARYLVRAARKVVVRMFYPLLQRRSELNRTLRIITKIRRHG